MVRLADRAASLHTPSRHFAMKSRQGIRQGTAVVLALCAATACASTPAAARQGIDWKAVDAAIGRPGVPQTGDIYRFNFPRSDLTVIASGVTLRPAFALGGWIAMKAMAGGGVMAMGDLVLTESEVAPVMSRLQQGDIDATAVHHHVLRESPRVMYMHVHAHGDPVKIGETIRAAVALTAIPAAAPGAVASAPIDLDTAAVTRTLGQPGRVNGGVFQVNVPRVEVIREGGVEIPAAMGLGTVMNFQPVGGGRAAITGDFVMIASEVTTVTRALRDAGIEVTALHNHMLAEEPRLFFMHFWAVDDAARLAAGLRVALDRTNSRRTAP